MLSSISVMKATHTWSERTRLLGALFPKLFWGKWRTKVQSDRTTFMKLLNLKAVFTGLTWLKAGHECERYVLQVHCIPAHLHLSMWAEREKRENAFLHIWTKVRFLALWSVEPAKVAIPFVKAGRLSLSRNCTKEFHPYLPTHLCMCFLCPPSQQQSKALYLYCQYPCTVYTET